MSNGRKKLLIELEEIIYEVMNKAKAGRYKGNPSVNPHKIRNQYYSSIASLINVYARLSKDIEIEELQKEIMELKEELKE